MVPDLVERFVRVSDDPVVDLFVAETPGPHAETLLVVHGGPDWDHTYLRDPLRRLGVERRVVWVDLRGCGRSTRGLPAAAYVPKEAVRDLIAVIADVGAPVDVLGFSYGGLLVQRLIVTAPHLVRRAIIASSSILPVHSDAFAGWDERAARMATQPKTEDGESDGRRTYLEAVATANANIWRLELLPAYVDLLEQVRFSSDWSRAWPDHARMPPARPDNPTMQLNATGVPLLLLHGRQDMTFPAVLVDETVALMPTTRGVVLDNAGHMAHIDQPDEWLNAVRDFLDQSA